MDSNDNRKPNKKPRQDVSKEDNHPVPSSSISSSSSSFPSHQSLANRTKEVKQQQKNSKLQKKSSGKTNTNVNAQHTKNTHHTTTLQSSNVSAKGNKLSQPTNNSNKRKASDDDDNDNEEEEEEEINNDTDSIEDDDDYDSETESDDLELQPSKSKHTRTQGSDTDSDDTDQDDEDEDSDDDDDDSSVDKINVDFVYQSPSDIDYKSVKRLLMNYLPGDEDKFDVGTLTDTIIQQNNIGTMIKVEDDLDVYAFTTILSVRQYINTTWMKQIRDYFARKCTNDSSRQQFLHYFPSSSSSTDSSLSSSSSTKTPTEESKAVLGLYLNERVINMPSELAPAMHESLVKDIIAWYNKQQTKDSSGSNNNSSNNITHNKTFCGYDFLLMIAPCWIERINNNSNNSSTTTTKLNYYHFEDELLAKEAEFVSIFHIASDDKPTTVSIVSASKTKQSTNHDNDNNDNTGSKSLRVPQARQIIVIKATKLPGIINKMKKILQEAEEAERQEMLSMLSKAKVGGGQKNNNKQ